MKMMIVILTALIGQTSFATVDGLTTLHLVIANYNDEPVYQVAEFPMNGCYGVPYGPQSAAFTEPFLVKTRRGCGGEAYEEDMNAISCADAKYKWNEDVTQVLSVAVDLSSCDPEIRNDDSLRNAVWKAARKNFGENVEVNVLPALTR